MWHRSVVLRPHPMKRALQQLIRDSPETEDQFEATAQFLEDLALHADDDIGRSRCLSAAREFRLAARSRHKPQGTNGRHKAEVMQPKSAPLRSVWGKQEHVCLPFPRCLRNSLVKTGLTT